MERIKKAAKRFYKLLKRVDNLLSDIFFDFLSDFLFPWILTDVIYTLLPIGVIIFIQLMTKGTSDWLYLSPEWSFASIVTYGAVITSVIEL